MRVSQTSSQAVIPANAGIQVARNLLQSLHWIPAFAGMTAFLRSLLSLWSLRSLSSFGMRPRHEAVYSPARSHLLSLTLLCLFAFCVPASSEPLGLRLSTYMVAGSVQEFARDA